MNVTNIDFVVEKLKNSAETIDELPLVSLDEDDGDMTQRAAREEPKLVPAKELEFQLVSYFFSRLCTKVE